ncbi:MAG: PcfB family protein [Ruminococcus sp.]|mgnify:CR=1 FL=1|nr:PcfB family protein [Ruminococcus sp.]
MSTDFEKGLRKTIDLSVKSKDFTVDVLKSAMNDFLSGKSQKKGRVSMKKLSEHSGKLENVEIKGIEDFLSVAKKYDIDFAVKKEQNSAAFHVFFQAGKMEDFKRAFKEFASNKQDELTRPRAEITRQQIKDMAKQVAHEPKKKEKVREKSKEMTH